MPSEAFSPVDDRDDFLRISLAGAQGYASPDDLRRRQAALYAEAAGAFAALPAHQRADFTFWGLEDSRSWLRRENASDAPLLFDDQGRASEWAEGPPTAELRRRRVELLVLAATTPLVRPEGAIASVAITS